MSMVNEPSSQDEACNESGPQHVVAVLVPFDV